MRSEMLNRSECGIMRRTLTSICLVGLAIPLAAQNSRQHSSDSNPPPLGFEVAAIHLTDPNDRFIDLHYTQSGVSITGAPLQMILGEAFNVTGDEVSRIPGWTKNARYSIKAKVADADVAKWRKFSMNEQRKVLRSLLEQRFALRYHTEPKSIPVYVLTIAKGGVRMKQAAAVIGNSQSTNSYLMPVGPHHFVGKSCEVSDLILVLGGEPELDNRKILDQTGLSSKYDLNLQWAPEENSSFRSDSSNSGAKSSGSSGEATISLFSALEIQLGLKLVLRKEMSDVIVIDSLEKPSAN